MSILSRLGTLKAIYSRDSTQQSSGHTGETPVLRTQHLALSTDRDTAMQPEQQQRIMGYFIEEAKDHLNTIEQGLMNLQSTIEDPEMVNEVFRAAHSVKGGAAMLGLNSIQKASHRLEDSFKILKECPVKIDQKLESLFLRVSDTLKELIEQLSGPFGLTEDIANSIMSGVEPVFEELNQHMALLVGGAGGMALEAANGTKAEAPMVMSAQYAGSSVRDGQAQKSVFTSDVLSQLREMLQLFKQADSARCREKLQEICGSLELLGEQFELPKWSQLIRTAGSAIANPENSYRTLASVVIKEIKQAQELVLAGRETSIEPSSQLKALIPLTAVVATGETHEAENYLQGAIATFEPAHQTSDRTVLAVEAGNLHNHHAIAIDGDRYADTPIQEEIVASVSSGATSWQEQALSPDVDNMFFEPANNKGRSKESATHRADPSGPEVGMAELNSLADLFEGESPELDETWQEEEVLSDVGHDLVNERHGESDFDEEGDSFDDFSDLLGDSLSGIAKPSPTATAGDELTNLFGEDFVDEATVDEQPSLQSVDDGFADMLFEDDSSLNTTSEDLSSLWDDNFIDEEESDSPEIATTATGATELSDEDLVVILAADNVEMAVAATTLEESFGEDGNAVGTDTDENESIFDAAPGSLESFDFELTAETSDDEVLEDWDTQPAMSTTEAADDWTADWSSEDLQILDGVSETEPSLTSSPEDWSDSMFGDELNADAALSDNLNGGMMADDESWTTDAGWEEEPDFSSLNLFETPVATPESQNVLEELVLDENGDLWLEENPSTAEELEVFGLDGVGEAMPDEDAIASTETSAVNDVNLDFNWPFTSNTEDTNPADTENRSAADLAWDTIDNPALSESTSADEDPNSQEFNQTQLEDPLSALDNLEIPREWAAGDPFALSETSETATTTDALELLDLDSPHPSPFNMDWDRAAQSATPEENVNEYLDEPLNLDFTELHEETPHTALDNFFSEEPEATETSDWDSSLDLTGFNLSEANTDLDAFDTNQQGNFTDLVDTNISESGTLPSSDDLFNTGDTSLESSVFDDAENSLVVFDTEPSLSTDALDWNEQNLLSSETDPDWEIPSATVPPIEAENIESMFGEDLSATSEALELSDEDLFASDDMNAEWDMSSMAPVEAEMDDMFGEDLSATPTEMDNMFGEDLSATPPVEAENLGDMFDEDLSTTTQSLELENLDDMFGEDLPGTTEDLFASDDMNAEWDISAAAMSPTENLEDMFGEDVSATNEALDLDADWDMLSAAVPEDADLSQADLLGVEPAEIGDMLDFEEDLFTAQMPSQDLAIATNQLNQIEALWGLTTEEDNDIETSETTEGLSSADFNALSFEEDKVSTAQFLGADEFDELEALLGEDAIGDQITPDLVLNNEFDELDALLGEQETASADILDEFADLEALLGDEPQAITPKAKQVSKSAAPASNTIDDEFGDLEILLGQAEETMGVPRSAKTSSSPTRPVNRTRQIKVFEQTMRVPVKHLDNLSNLVGELVVNRNTLEQDQERLRQFLDNLLHQVQQLSDVGARMQDRYERSLLESSLLASRQGNRFNPRGDRDSQSQDNTPANSRFGLGELELDLFTPFHTLSQEIIELIVRVRESAADIEFLVDETDQVARMLRQITSQLQEGLTRSRMVPFANTADRLPRAVRDISIRCGKQAELHIEGRETLLDKVILEHLSDPMTHLINNAITHGIETPEVRKAAGKPPVGRITIRAFHQGNQTVISVSDDGAGVDAERVKSKAIEKGLITPEQATTMTRLDVYDLLFHPGFTTKDKEDEFAGRGIGMNVVRENLTEIRGVINTDSTLGKGTTFTVRLPLTLSICKALCCLIDRTRIAFPMDGVEDMLDVPQERIQTNAEGQTSIYWRDSLMPFQPLSELLTYNRHLSRGNVYGGKRDDDMISVVVLRSSGNYIAVQVDQVLGEQEIVIKQLEGPVPKPLGVAGATVLGDGRIMPIADVLELIDLATGRIGKDRGVSLWDKSGVPAPVEVPEVKTDPMVLIVDDSITVRELLSMTFNKAGYRVEQARDGQEAWDKLRSGLPCEIVFCDIEMPRMDGLELLSRIQKDPTLSHLPVAMLTSRGASKHQQMAAQFGAKGYFTKPYLEEVLLDAAQRMIKGEVLLSINSNA